MKEQWSISKDKLVNIEDGLICNETPYVRPTVQSDTCKKLIQWIKFILYLELLLFVGWGCYAIWQTYRVESIEVKVTDSIHESEPLNLHDPRLHLEESTITPDEFLTQMENLLQAENALSKTVDTLQKQMDDDGVNTDSKTMEDVNSGLQNTQESSINVKPPPLPETDVPEMIVVDLEKDAANDEPEGSELTKSEESVLEWSFGLLLFPGALNVRDQSQISANDGSEQLRTAENLSGNDENIDSEEADKLIKDIATALHDAKLNNYENVASLYERLRADDSLPQMDDFGLLPMPVMLTPPEFGNPELDKDEANVDRTVREDMHGKGLVHIILNNQEPVAGIQDAFARENPVGVYESQVDESLFDTTTDELVNNPEDDSQVDQPAWMTTDEVFVSPSAESELSGFMGNTRLFEKRSISDVPVKDQHLWNNERVGNLMNKPKQEVIYNRVSNEGTTLNTLTNGRAASLLDNYIREEENLLAQEIASVPNREQQLMKSDLNNFIHKMEILASHIDKLHERYLYLHELNDDYISEEFPSDNLTK